MKSSRSINAQYIDWLCEKIGVFRNTIDCNIQGAIEVLWNTPYNFDPCIMYEDNVYENSLSLRHEFFGIAEPDIKEVRVLEVLVNLCVRYEWFDGDITASQAFTNVLNDLGYSATRSLEDFRFIVDMANNRAYDSLGRGSFFDCSMSDTPAIDKLYDARFADLWTQIRHRYL